jgi:hypothetical protein
MIICLFVVCLIVLHLNDAGRIIVLGGGNCSALGGHFICSISLYEIYTHCQGVTK